LAVIMDLSMLVAFMHAAFSHASRYQNSTQVAVRKVAINAL
jgi:hypothetical protein